jgi:hypothetical protein
VATLSFAGTDRKIFTPISSALANLPNGAGTMVVLIKRTAIGSTDWAGLTDSGLGNWYHTLGAGGTSGQLFDDDGLVGPRTAGAFAPDNTTNWYWFAVDWPGTGAATERFHFRDQTGLGSWGHANTTGNNGGLRAGPGTGGWFRIGYAGDSANTKLEAVVAVWAGTRFADGDYGDWRKTSDLYNHALGHPTLLVECNAATLVDLIGGSTYSSANSSGTSLTGADPDNFTFDGIGSTAPVVPQRRSQRPGWRPGMGPRNLVERRWPVTVAGQNYTITPSGVIAPAGALAKSTSKPLSGAMTPSGALAKSAQVAKAGTIAPTGALAKSTSKPLSGAVTPSGALVRLTAKLLGGTITPSGALALARVILKALAGSITPAGALIKVPTKALTGAATPTGALVRSAAKSFAAAITPAGALAKLTAKRYTGSITPAGALGLTRVVLRSFAGTVSSAGALTRQTRKQLAGAATPAGSLRRSATKTLAGIVVPAGALRKLISRRLIGAIATAGTVARQTGAAVWSLLRLRSWDHRAITSRLRDHRAISTELRDHQADDTETSEH